MKSSILGSPGREVRKPPTDAVFASHAPHALGKCDWCGEPCDEVTDIRKQLKKRHSACHDEFLIIIRPDVARRFVERRDHGVCADCGEDWSERFIARPEFARDRTKPEDGPVDTYSYHNGLQYCRILWVSLWQVDHKIPLWGVRHMPDIKRIEYFKLANLITRCEPCHGFKTAEEAGQRAKINRVEKRNAESSALVAAGKKPKHPTHKLSNRSQWPKRKKEWPKGRKLRSRPMRKS